MPANDSRARRDPSEAKSCGRFCKKYGERPSAAAVQARKAMAEPRGRWPSSADRDEPEPRVAMNPSACDMSDCGRGSASRRARQSSSASVGGRPRTARRDAPRARREKPRVDAPSTRASSTRASSIHAMRGSAGAAAEGRARISSAGRVTVRASARLSLARSECASVDSGRPHCPSRHLPIHPATSRPLQAR